MTGFASEPRRDGSLTAPTGVDELGNGAQSVERAIRILFALSAADPSRGVGLTDLSRALGLNKTTVRRLLITLVSCGLVAQARKGAGYHLGRGLIELGMAATVQSGQFGLQARTIGLRERA